MSPQSHVNGLATVPVSDPPVVSRWCGILARNRFPDRDFVTRQRHMSVKPDQKLTEQHLRCPADARAPGSRAVANECQRSRID